MLEDEKNVEKDEGKFMYCLGINTSKISMLDSY